MPSVRKEKAPDEPGLSAMGITSGFSDGSVSQLATYGGNSTGLSPAQVSGLTDRGQARASPVRGT